MKKIELPKRYNQKYLDFAQFMTCFEMFLNGFNIMRKYERDIVIKKLNEMQIIISKNIETLTDKEIWED